MNRGGIVLCLSINGKVIIRLVGVYLTRYFLLFSIKFDRFSVRPFRNCYFTVPVHARALIDLSVSFSFVRSEISRDNFTLSEFHFISLRIMDLKVKDVIDVE